MKTYCLDTKKKFLKHFGSIRKKRDVILLLLDTMMLFHTKIDEVSFLGDFANLSVDSDDDISIVFHIDKMKRVFFYTKDKIHSMCFPFSINLDESIKIYFHEEMIDCALISKLITIFLDETFEDIYGLTEMAMSSEVIENWVEIDEMLLYKLVLHLIQFEDGYLRFDFNDSENEQVEYHPLNHIDFYYSNSNTLKLGLTNQLNFTDSIEIIDTSKKCYFINKTNKI